MIPKTLDEAMQRWSWEGWGSEMTTGGDRDQEATISLNVGPLPDGTCAFVLTRVGPMAEIAAEAVRGIETTLAPYRTARQARLATLEKQATKAGKSVAAEVLQEVERLRYQVEASKAHRKDGDDE